MKLSRPVRALRALILFSAITHLLILAWFTLVHGDITIFNYFNILDLDFFFPGIEQGMLSQVLSVVVAVGIYGVFYFVIREQD